MPPASLPSRNPSPPPDSPPERPAHRLRSSERLEALLADLGPQIERGPRPREAGAALSSGQLELDALIGGGFPRGAISELAGGPSSGRTSVVLGALAHVTGPRAELAAFVDGPDAFDPPSAEAAGVDLRRMIWARVGRGRMERAERRRGRSQKLDRSPQALDWQPALRCAEHLVQTEGLPLVVLDLGSELARPPTAAWLRLARAAAGSRSALLVLSESRQVGSQAGLALAFGAARARWQGVPPLLDRLAPSAELIRKRNAR